MKGKFNKIWLIAPFLTGAFLFSAGFYGGGTVPEKDSGIVCARAYAPERLPKGVKVNGIPVGGMQGRKAEKMLRKFLEERVPSLSVKTPAGEYRFSYPQIGFSDNLEEILFSAEKNGEYTAEVQYFLCGLEEQTEFICSNVERKVIDAEVSFSSEGFSFEKERSGVRCDKERLKKDIQAALAAAPSTGENGKLSFPAVSLSTRTIYPKITESAAKAGTKKISSFVTYFNTEDKGRSANIALAAKKIDGMTIRPKEEFSFNRTVGARTKANGFREAKIIQDGEFILGTGGGVCQVSTTLYNAAVLAGLKITARHPHSLAVAYVPPSRDAMVSSYNDFRFKNEFSYPVYLSLKVKGEGITATFYGKDNGYTYEIISEVTGEIPPPDPIEKKGNFEGVIKEGKAGIKSIAYLETYRYGKLVKREKLRSDSYAPIRGVVGKKKEE